MAQGTIGVQVAATDAPSLLKQIEEAEKLGIPAVWATSDLVDALTLFAAAAARTGRVLMGTAITRAGPRHPISMAQQAAVVGQLAPGRFRLGIGPWLARQAAMYGPGPTRSLAHLRAYIRTVKGLLQAGEADVEEAGVVAHSRLANPVPLPVMASALQPASFALCGAVADGAITWICPAGYVQNVALSALRTAAAAAEREPPPLIMHVPVILSTDTQAVRAAMQERFAFYLRVPNYLAMFAEAGFAEAKEGQWSQAMVDAVAVHGTETAVAERLRGLLAMGAAELLVTALGAGPDAAAGTDHVLRLIGELAGS